MQTSLNNKVDERDGDTGMTKLKSMQHYCIFFFLIHKLLIFLGHMGEQNEQFKCLFPPIICDCTTEALVSLASFVLQTLLRCEARPIGVKAGGAPIQLGIVRPDQGPARRKHQLKTRQSALPGEQPSSVWRGTSLTPSSELG